jgi:thymidylate synthase
MRPEEAVVRIGLNTQFFCTANPAGWDPIGGKSPVHHAGDLHAAALKRALVNPGPNEVKPEMPPLA